MDFIKRHRMKLILLSVFILIFIIALITLIGLLYPDLKKSIYGNRLEGINEVKVSNQEITAIKDELNSSKLVNDTDYVLKGRLINFAIELKENVKKEDAKKLVEIILKELNDEVEKYYDIQVVIVEENKESKDYPIFAYKHKSNQNFVWTNN